MKFALLTPYTGGNLGDAAIQEAVISNIRRRYSHSQICLITLSPGTTSQLHGVPAYPIGVTTFGPGFELRNDKVPSNETVGSLFAHIKTTVKRYPVLYATLLRIHQIYQIYQKVMVLIGFRELLHIGTAFRVMRGVSMLIVSGGGQLDDYWGGAFRQPYALLKWGLISKVLGTKFVVMSVGTCSLSKLSMFFVKRALGLADYRSYRDQTSKDLLASIKFTRDDPVYPDLAFSYVRNLYQRSAPGNNVGRVVGVSPIAYLSRYGWPETNLAVYDNYVKSLVGFVSELIKHDYT
ncbi:MAG: polysaccharide pyruvyl transferase family protein, partial [Pyrinomonadaceae bacterium]